MNAIVTVAASPAAAPTVAVSHGSRHPRRRSATNPTSASSTRDGATTGSEADRSIVSNWASPITSFDSRNVIHGNSRCSSTPSGRVYVTSAVGANSTPNNPPPVDSSVACRAGSYELRTWSRNGMLTGSPKRAWFTAA